MSYFIEHKKNIDFFHKNLREAQRGAIGSIASHFSIDNGTPGIVVMPTGVGKTAVLALTPFLLESQSVLVITSTALVRSQVCEELKGLGTLVNTECFTGDAFPEVFECSKALEDRDLEKINKSDIVVGIPGKLLSLFEEELDASEDYFDLILVDESHHLPAMTWTKIVNKFPSAKKVFFTATPYRRDKQPIPGKIIYNYPLKRAYDQGVFGKVEYCPVTATNNQDIDILIAKKAEETLLADREEGYRHVLLARTDSKKHAKELLKVYEKNTGLKLKVIDSSKTNRVLKASIKKLREGELDGLICVDMMGEGFDFPHLKIAAIHRPHKSEAISLQFIGRFARTNASDIGSAKFIAEPTEIRSKINALYKEGAVWNEIIIDIHHQIVDAQLAEKEAVSSFSLEEGEELEDLSLFSLAPYSHVKIYNVESINGTVNLNKELEVSGQEVVQRLHSNDLNCSIHVMVEKSTPKWVKNNQLENRKYHLYIIFYYEERNLLFINSTDKTDQLYELLFMEVTGEEERKHYEFQISRTMINKVLLSLNEVSFFNIGMQKRMPNSGESYRTLTGPNAQSVIQKTDGVLFSGGHMFCKAIGEASNVTVGYSSASKVWSNSYKTIADFISWCKLNGEKIFSTGEVKTNSGFDHLPLPIRATELPENIFSAYWDYQTYKQPPVILVGTQRVQLLDYGIEITDISNGTISFNLIHEEFDSLPMIFTLANRFSMQAGKAPETGDGVSLTKYLNDNPILFQTTDFGVLSGSEYTKGYVDESLLLEKSCLEVWDWAGLGINIQSEFGQEDSIHEKLVEKLVEEDDADVIIYDHGPSEIADIVTFKRTNQTVEVNMYHVKGSSSRYPGNRVDEVYEVCGQVVKSVIFSNHRDSLRRKVRQRVLGREDRKFKKGDFHTVDDIFSEQIPIRVQMIIVQPGITKTGVADRILSILAACDSFILKMGNFSQVKILCSD